MRVVATSENEASSDLDSVIADCDSNEKQEYLTENLLNLWTAVKHVKDEIDHKNIVTETIIFLGLTASGKSTQRMLLCNRDDNFSKLEIKEEPPCIRDRDGTEIGNTSGYSCTSGPTFFQVGGVNGTTWIDAPGAKDNRGAFREIVGMDLLNHAANRAMNVKCLLFVDADEFKSGKNRENLVKHFDYAKQIINHDNISDLKSFGLVVTKVEPDQDEDHFKEQIIDRLKAVFDEQAKTDSHLSSLIQVISSQNIFLVKYPDKSNVQDYDKKRTYTLEEFGALQYYTVMCQNFINFCAGMESATKLGHFTVTPSDSTRNKLMEKIYPKLVTDIHGEIKSILKILEGDIESQFVTRDQNNNSLQFHRALTSARQTVSSYCFGTKNKRRIKMSTSELLKNMGTNFGLAVSQNMFDRLESSERLLNDLTMLTNTHHVNYTEILELISSFKNKLDNWHNLLRNSLTEADTKQVQVDVTDLVNKVNDQVVILQNKYKERHEEWTKDPLFSGRAIKNLQRYLSSMQSLNDASTFIEIYDQINIPVSNALRNEFISLNLEYDHLMELCGQLILFKSPVSQMQIFIQNLSNNFPLEKWQKDIAAHLKEKVFPEVYNFIEHKVLEENFYVNLNVITMQTKIDFLKSVVSKVNTFLQQRDGTTNITISQVLSQFCKEIDVCDVLQEHKFQVPMELISDPYISNAIEPSWHSLVEKFLDRLNTLVVWYNCLNVFLNDCELYNSMKIGLKTLPSDDCPTPQVGDVPDNACVLTSKFRKSHEHQLEKIMKSMLSQDGHTKDRGVFKAVLQSASHVTYNIINDDTLLVMGPGNVHFSDILEHKRLNICTPEERENVRNVIILAGKTIFVNHTIKEGADIRNLFIAGKHLQNVGHQRIFLCGENREHIHERAADGRNPGEKGQDGVDGEDGGRGGNIYVVTEEELDCSNQLKTKSLKIKSYGGEAGWGQDGGYGHCGLDKPAAFLVLCHKLQNYFAEFDDMCKIICAKLEIENPQLPSLHLAESSEESVLNVELCEKVELAWSIVIAMYAAIERNQDKDNPVLKIPDNHPDYCFCSSKNIITHHDDAVLPKKQIELILGKGRYTRLKVLTALADVPDLTKVKGLKLLTALMDSSEVNSEGEKEDNTLKSKVISFLANESRVEEAVPLTLPMDRVNTVERKIWCYPHERSVGCVPLITGSHGKISESILCMMKGARNKMRDICKAYYSEKATSNDSISKSMKVTAKATHLKFKKVNQGAGGKGGVGGRSGCPGVVKVLHRGGEDSSFESQWCVMQHGKCSRDGRDGLMGGNKTNRRRADKVRNRKKSGNTTPIDDNSPDFVMSFEDAVVESLMTCWEGKTEITEQHGKETENSLEPENIQQNIMRRGRTFSNGGCVGDCREDEDNPFSATTEMASLLKKCIKELDRKDRCMLVSLLAPHQWAMEHVFTTEFFLDEYLSYHGYSETSLFTQAHLEAQLQFQERIRTFKMINPSLRESKVLQYLLACSTLKTDALLYQLEYRPVIFDLESWLQNYKEYRLDQLHELKLNDSSRAYLMKYYDDKINKVETELEQSIPEKLAEIDRWFLQQKEELKDKIDGFITIIKADSRYKRAQIVLDGISKALSPFGRTNYYAAGASGAFAGLAALVALGISSTPTPMSLVKNSVHDQNQFRKDIGNMIDQEIDILKRFTESNEQVNEFQEVVNEFCDIQTSLGDIKDKIATCTKKFKKDEKPEIDEKKLLTCITELEEIHSKLFGLLDEKQKATRGNEELSGKLYSLHLDLRMADPENELYEKTKDSILRKAFAFCGIGDVKEVKYAKQRAEETDKKFAPLIDLFLESVKGELGKDVPSETGKWNITDMIMNVENYASSYFDGLPCQSNFELGFRKMKQVLKLYTTLWSQIVSYEEAKEINSYFTSLNFRLDVPQIGDDVDQEMRVNLENVEYVTQSELALLHYKKFQRAALQFAFPNAGRYITPSVKKDMDAVNELLNGKLEKVTKQDITDTAEKCRNIVTNFKRAYSDNKTEASLKDGDNWITTFSNDSPLYKWKNSEFGDKIKNLILGHPTQFMADIMGCGNVLEALKVNNKIKLQFVIKEECDSGLQEELDKLVKNFVMEMIHSGKSYYKIGGDVYMIVGEKLKFGGNIQSVKGNTGGVMANGVANESENDTSDSMSAYLLSPFTEWVFRLDLAPQYRHRDREIVFEELADKFAYCVDLQLVGPGRYLAKGAAVPIDIQSFYTKIVT